MVDHCLFHGVKQTVVFWTPGSTGHAMRNCLALNSYTTGVWTSGIANDFDFQSNVIANGNYVWIGQGARSASAEIAGGAGRGDTPGQRGGRGGAPGAGRGAPGADAAVDPANRYRVRNSLFAGNKKFTGTGGGPLSTSATTIPLSWSSSTLFEPTSRSRSSWMQSKRNYLHAVDGTDAARYNAGLFRT